MLYIDGEDTSELADKFSEWQDQGLRVQFETPASEGRDAESRCKRCSRDLVDYGELQDEEDQSPFCPEEFQTSDDDEEDRLRHDPEPLPLTWFNSAAFDFSAEEDSVTVSISVGDPRGAFAFTIRRLPAHTFEPYSDAPERCRSCGELPQDRRHSGRGQLVMHTPYERMGMPHVPVKKVSDGTYLIGEEFRQ